VQPYSQLCNKKFYKKEHNHNLKKNGRKRKKWMLWWQLKRKKKNSNDVKMSRDSLAPFSSQLNMENTNANTNTKVEPLVVKAVLLGKTSVGKSCLIVRLVKNEFVEDMATTVGAVFLSKMMKQDDARPIKLEIWDTAGMERFRTLTPMYYRGAQLALVVYDITDFSSLEDAVNWMRELAKQGSPDCRILLIGNKIDLDTDREVAPKDVNQYKELYTVTAEVSAKTRQGIDDLEALLHSEASTFIKPGK